MPATHLTLVLEPSREGQGCAPNYEHWTPALADGSRRVAIYNASGYEQTLSDITPGLLNPTSSGRQITLAPKLADQKNWGQVLKIESSKRLKFQLADE